MNIAAYLDGIVALLKSAGVPASEIEENGTEDKLVHAFSKGVAFEVAAMAVLKEHRVEIVE